MKFIKKENDRLNRYAYNGEPFIIYLGRMYRGVLPSFYVLRIEWVGDEKDNYFAEYHEDEPFIQGQIYDKYFLPAKAAIEARIAQNG